MAATGGGGTYRRRGQAPVSAWGREGVEGGGRAPPPPRRHAPAFDWPSSLPARPHQRPASGTPAAPARHLHTCARAADWPGFRRGGPRPRRLPPPLPQRRATGKGGFPSVALPTQPGLTWGGGRRGRGRCPLPTWPRHAADPIAGAVTPGALGGLGAGKVLGPAPLWPERRAVQWARSLAAPPRSATSGRALAAASPPRGPAATSGPAGSPRPRVDRRRGRRRGHSFAGHFPARLGVRRGTGEGFPEPPLDTVVISDPRFSLWSETAVAHACAVKSGAKRVSPR